MKPHFSLNGRTLALVGVLTPLFGAFLFVAVRSGPLAPVPVVVTTVTQEAITPSLFGIGTVEARYTYRIGPTVPGRVKHVDVQVGDRVQAGQLLGEMDPIDLDERVAAQDAALERANSNVRAAQAQLEDVSARHAYARAQAERYDRLLAAKTASAEAAEAKRQEYRVLQATLQAARANLNAARHELTRVRAEREALVRQRANLRLVAPVDGLVTARNADPGTTVIAGQSVVEVIDPASLWVNVRFDQHSGSGLRSGLDARVVLRSQAHKTIDGRVFRVEPVADAVTEEMLAKVVFDALPEPLPPIGELAEVTVALSPLPARPVLPNASVRRMDGRLGVWVLDEDEDLRFSPVRLGATDLDGQVQILEGLRPGARVVVYSQRALGANNRVQIVDRLPGTS